MVQSDFFKPIEDAVQSYVVKHSASSLPPDEVLLFWAVAGAVIFSASCAGNLGGRIGWCVFGALTSGIAFDGASPPGQWTTAGIVALSWSGLSIAAFRKVEPNKSYRRASQTRTEEQKLEELEFRAIQSVKRRGFSDLDDYFAERGNQNLHRIADDLNVSPKYAGLLRSDLLETSISTRSSLTPRIQRQIISDIRSSQFSDTQICERNNCDQAFLRRAKSAIAKSINDA